MSMLVVLAFGAFRAAWPAGNSRCHPAEALRRFLPIGLAVAAGLAAAAIQALPTWELVQHSVRAGGLSEDFLTSFSWHPALLGTLAVPFALGNPYPNIAVALRPGRHTVTFIYDPPTFKIGAVISALTLVILAVTAGLMLLGRDSGREPT